MHPNRLRFAMFSDQNPMMQPVKALAESVRAARQPASRDNPLLAIEQTMESWITTCLQNFGEFRDTRTEAAFLNTYGSPLLQALVGLGGQKAAPHHIERDLAREAGTARLHSELEHRFAVGGMKKPYCGPLPTSACRKAASMGAASLYSSLSVHPIRPPNG